MNCHLPKFPINCAIGSAASPIYCRSVNEEVISSGGVERRQQERQHELPPPEVPDQLRYWVSSLPHLLQEVPLLIGEFLCTVEVTGVECFFPSPSNFAGFLQHLSPIR
ncbi:hypothetical protein J6590_070982 [Homalodisca vitripennis]|nr:hypothetical protein J6590_070982 [Homalodisca vitripennis]